MKRALLASSLAAFSAACATTGSVDPTQDTGLFDTIAGVSGGYENHTLDQLRALEEEQAEGRALENERRGLEAEREWSRQQVASLQGSIANLRSDISGISARLAAARQAGAATDDELATLEARIRAAEAASARLDTGAMSASANYDALERERQRLAEEARDLELLTDQLSF